MTPRGRGTTAPAASLEEQIRARRRVRVGRGRGSALRLLLLTEDRRVPDPARPSALGLTRREAEILTWVARGRSNEATARILAISPRTVAKHLENIYRKLGVETRVGAAALLFNAPSILT